MLADLFTTFGNSRLAYIGQSFFTIAYLCLGCYQQQFRDNHNRSHLVLIVASVALAAINLSWLYAPELHKEIYYIQMATHASVLLYIGYNCRHLLGKADATISNLFTAGIVVVLLTNIIYGLDVLWFHRKYALIDSIVGLGNGVYMFLLCKSVLQHVKRV